MSELPSGAREQFPRTHTPETLTPLQRLDALDHAMNAVLEDADKPLPVKERGELLAWADKGGSLDKWPLNDTVTAENYREVFTRYGVANLIDPALIEAHDSPYSLLARHYEKEFTGVLRAGESTPSTSETTAVTPTDESEPAVNENEDEAEDAEDKDEDEAEEKHELAWQLEDPDKISEINRGWKVWETLFALLHSMQTYPEKFELLRGLPPNELQKKLTAEGPELVRQYMQFATRGGMEWDSTKEMWAPNPVKETNMDVKVGLYILRRAGFRVEVNTEGGNVQMVAPGGEGSAEPFVLQFDTMDNAKRRRLEQEGKTEHLHIETAESKTLREGEYRVTVDHHTDDPQERQTSGAQLLYDYFTAAGLIKRDAILEKLLELTNLHDNGQFPRGVDFYQRSAKTLWGIGGDTRVPAEALYRIMEQGRQPADELTEEDLTIPLQQETPKDPKTIGEVVKRKEKSVRDNLRVFDIWRQRGYLINTDYGPLWVVIDVEGRSKTSQLVARAHDIDNILIWSPEQHSFFIALGGGKTFQPTTAFPQGDMIRRTLVVYKKQERTPEPLTTPLREILTTLTRKTGLKLRGDLRAFVEGEPAKTASTETLFHLYHTYPKKRDAVLRELASRQSAQFDAVARIEEIRDTMPRNVKGKYQELIDELRRHLGEKQKRRRKK